MNAYMLIINTVGFEEMSIKLVEKDVYEWVKSPINPKASIELVPISVYNKMSIEKKHMSAFKGQTNEIKMSANHKIYRMRIAPSIKDGFDDLEKAKKYAEDNDINILDTYIKYAEF